MINVKANGYQELPDWPEVPPDASVRDVDVEMSWSASLTGKSKLTKKKAEKEKSFYSEDESSSSEGLLPSLIPLCIVAYGRVSCVEELSLILLIALLMVMMMMLTIVIIIIIFVIIITVVISLYN